MDGEIAAGRGLPRLAPDRANPNANDNDRIEVADTFPAEWLAAPAESALVAA